MQRGRRTTMTISIPDLDMESVKSVDFTFKQHNVEKATPLKVATYPGTATYNADIGAFLIPWTVADTYLFKPGSFYVGIRVNLDDSMDMPEIAPVRYEMDGTLFAEGE